MRLFIALDINDNIKKNLYNTLKNNLSVKKGIKIVEKENLHLTLIFLGEQTPENLIKIKESIKYAAEGINNFYIDFFDFSAFPSKEKPKIIWSKLRTCPVNILNTIYFNLEKNLSKNNIFFKPSKKLTFHLTLLRIKQKLRQKDFEQVYNLFNKKTHFGRQNVNEIKLYQSILHSKGPEYINLFSAKLKNGKI